MLNRIPFLPFLGAFVLLSLGCRPSPEDSCDEQASPGDLVINEVVSKNGGVAIDSWGATSDFLELVNTSDRSIDLGLYAVTHGSGSTSLPNQILPAGQRILLFANDSRGANTAELDFKISSSGEALSLTTCGSTIDTADVPELAENEAFARHPDGEGALSICRYATPGRVNGEECSPPVPHGLVSEVTFDPYDWPGPHPEVSMPLALSEAALFPAEFVEIENTSDEEVDLEGYSLRLAPIFPGQPLPMVADGIEIPLAAVTLAPGELMTFGVTDEHTAVISEDPKFEGVLSLFDPEGSAVDRWDFMRWPEGATLARHEEGSSHTYFCEESTPMAQNECAVLASRAVGDRVRGIRTLGDFAALSEGGTSLGTSSVKFVVDVKQGDRVHLLRAEDWALHYTFIREVIEAKEPLDRCDPEQRAAFNQGWRDFSATEYYTPEGRSYFLGTLVKHGSSGHKTVEFTLGDAIASEDTRRIFFLASSRLPDAHDWALRPQGEEQIERMSPVEGTVPIVSTNAPFEDLVYQPLTHGEGYGVLTWVSASDLQKTALGSQVILVTDDVPNDIPLVGGLITQSFQTPLAHVNVLSQNRGTPNMAHRNASDDPRIAQHLGQLVRLVVAGDDFTIEPADPVDAEAFWEKHRPTGPAQSPRLDTEQRDLVDLKAASLASLPAIGAKAAQLAELYNVAHVGPPLCSGSIAFAVPKSGFAIPVVHFLEHFEASGAKQALADFQGLERFTADPLYRAAMLQIVQYLIKHHEVDPDLLDEVEETVYARFGKGSVRFRSSSNAEDLPGFNGAGLYTSLSASTFDSGSVADAIRTVWASLYNPRAYDERELSRIDHSAVAMGVLVHEAFPDEAANGVGVSRNVLDPIRGDIYYINAQAGEASVTNPAPGVTTEAVEFQWPPRTPLLTLNSESSLIAGEVLTEQESIGVACALASVHSHFRPLLDPEGEDPWFAMEIEFKLLQPTRRLLVKQARPHAFGGFEIASDCREL